jgi:hypothetical protein
MGEAVNLNELRVIGMSRSGNHAIIQWMMAQLGGRVCFLNCAEGKSNPFRSARVMDNGQICRATWPEFDLEAERQGRFSPKDWLIFSHEDSYLGRAVSREFELGHDQWVGRSARRSDVLILRDPFNLFASRLQCLWAIVTLKVSAKIWKQHAREFLGQSRLLRHDPVRISYNRWRADQDYRRRIAGQLGLDFTDAGIHKVVPCNGGSSFDGTRFDGRAGRMRVLERWKHYIDDPRYLGIFDREMLELSEQIFGPAPCILLRRIREHHHRDGDRRKIGKGDLIRPDTAQLSAAQV